jgi:SpoVK/Ycf46/Vps4 family AAA+-type ATPase
MTTNTPQPAAIEVKFSPGEQRDNFVEKLKTALQNVNENVNISVVDESDETLLRLGPMVRLVSPPDPRLVFIGQQNDFELQLIALAVRSRGVNEWFESVVETIRGDAIPLLQQHTDQNRNDYVTGFLLSQFDKLQIESRLQNIEHELLDIIRPAWLAGNSSAAMFVAKTNAERVELTLLLGHVVENGEWAWQFSVPVSRTNEIELAIHEVPASNVPIELRRFVTLKNLSDDSTIPEIQMLFESQDFERLIQSINKFRRGEFDLQPHQPHQAPSVEQPAESDEQDQQEVQLTREEALAQALEELEGLVGLSTVKTAVNDFTNFMRVSQQRRRNGVDAGDISTHFVFTGSPGTGKTTVARLIAKILYGLEMLDSYKLNEVLRSDLVAGFVGQTAIKTKEVVDASLGGVLFIDEAYSLTSREGTDFGAEAIETLLAEMENNRDNLCVVAAGYQDKMEQFLSSNPGLRSRFSRTIYFPDYSPDELVEIFRRICSQKGFVIGQGVEAKVDAYFTRARAKENFGNGREVRQLLEDTIVRQANRIAASLDTLSHDELQTLTMDDVVVSGDSTPPKLDEEGLAASLAELDELIGQDEVKRRIQSFVALARGQIRRRELGLTNQIPTLTFAFIGPSGTGKTTVASLLGKIFLNLGLLRRGQTITTSRADMVASYVGQTASKTREQVGRALDGVLFVDEAYSLTPTGMGSENDFGKEAIQELLTQMESNRERLSVIFAGYENEMETFLNSNPGLKNRIGEIVVFESYSPDDLCLIFESFGKKAGYMVPREVRADLKAYFTRILEHDNSGQARAARTLLDDAIRLQATRLLSHSSATREDFERLSINDIRVSLGLGAINESTPATYNVPIEQRPPDVTPLTPIQGVDGSPPESGVPTPPLASSAQNPSVDVADGPVYVIDGSNVATEAGRALFGARVCSVKALREARNAIKERFLTENVVVVVDANFRHRVHESEKEDANEALNNGEFMQPPAGAVGRGDGLLLHIASELNGIVVSNDSFNKPGEPFITQHPWLLQPNRIIGHNYNQMTGWIFTPRQLR